MIEVIQLEFFPLNFTKVIDGTTSALEVIQVSLNTLAKVVLDDRISPCATGRISAITNKSYSTWINASGQVKGLHRNLRRKLSDFLSRLLIVHGIYSAFWVQDPDGHGWDQSCSLKILFILSLNECRGDWIDLILPPVSKISQSSLRTGIYTGKIARSQQYCTNKKNILGRQFSIGFVSYCILCKQILSLDKRDLFTVKIVSFWTYAKQVYLEAHHKRDRFPQPGFLSCHTSPLHAQRPLEGLHVVLSDTRSRGSNISMRLTLLTVPWVLKLSICLKK